jgi:hypothetical protein
MDTMNQEAFQKWTDIANHIQQPFQALTELNMRAIQNFKYLKPEDLTNIKKPEVLLEKQMAVFIENGHSTLEYMKKSFAILENMMLFMYDQGKDSGISPPNPMTTMQMAESALANGANPISDVANAIMQPVVDHSIKPPKANKKIMPDMKKTKPFADNSTNKFPADDKPWDIKK